MLKDSSTTQPFWAKPYFIAIIYIVLALVISIRELISFPHIDNFIAFRNGFAHLIEGKNLYGHYYQEYNTLFNYGPTFAALMSIFWVLPFGLSAVVWNVIMVLVMFYSIRQMPIGEKAKTFILLFSLHELFTAVLNFQTNPAIAGIIILTFVFLEKEMPFWAAAVLTLGILTKLYPAIAGAFFLLYRKQFWRFTGSFAFWTIVWVALPLFFVSPSHLVWLYQEWYSNLLGHSQRVSMTVMGVLTMLSGYPVSNGVVILPAILLFLSMYLKYRYFDEIRFKLLFLASMLLFVVIFNPGSESPTYIIAFVGVAIWLAQIPTWGRIHWVWAILVLILGSLSTTDIVPTYYRRLYVYDYQLKALPYILTWCWVMYDVWTYRGDLVAEKVG
ncbi:MAG: DUF2029 domain-containing protein [Cytophagales bacterium]|nr:MAG: DUF2029 domain-containing protein [Cytophagales bacterium]